MTADKESILVQIEPREINYLNRIMEGYEYLGVVTTVDARQGILKIRVTRDTYDEVIDILAHLPLPVTIIEESA